jgi:serine/threonine-protein kinase
MPAPDPRAEARVGSVLHDKWTLERLLGVGGMGAVYAARHRNGARAAVKILSPESGRQAQIRERFLREGYAANRVEHPGAVKVLDDDVIGEGPDADTAYLVMELLEGESLQDRVKRDPPLTERDLLEIADGVLAVLEAAHANGVVHRDLKPDNLFLAKDPERPGAHVKVLDFGLARLLETGVQTYPGMAIGTPTYMSPEQAAGQVQDIDGRTDIYALGSILFQLLSHQRIHDAAHTLGLVVRMATTPAPKLASVAPSVSEDFAAVVDRALEFRREDRYPTASAMRADVRAALEKRASVEASTVNVIPASWRSSGLATGTAPTVLAELPTTEVQGPPESGDDAAARSIHPSDPPADEVRAPEAHDDDDEPSDGGSLVPARPRRRGSAIRTLVVLGVAAAGWFFAWKNWAAIEDVVFPQPAAGVDGAAGDDALPTAVPLAAGTDAAPDADESDAGDRDDGAAVVELDAAAGAEDAGDGGDAGDDDDDEDDEDELDAAAEAAAPAAGPRRAPHPAVKPVRKPKPHRRPGHPHRRRWRRH